VIRSNPRSLIERIPMRRHEVQHQVL